MFIGVNFYSLTIGMVSGVIANSDNQSAGLNTKLATLTEYALKFNLPKETELKIKLYYENQHKNGGDIEDWDDLYDELPPSLRQDIVKQTHG